jgi:hypothetical protein
VLGMTKERYSLTCLHYRVSIGRRLVTDIGSFHNRRSTTTLLGFVHLSVPQHVDLNTPGYVFTSSVLQHYCHSTLIPKCA